MSQLERLSTVVVTSGNVTDLSASLWPLTVLSPDMFLLVEDGDSRDSLLLAILAEVSTYTGKLLTLPSGVSLEELPALKVSKIELSRILTEYSQTFQTNIVAGKLPNTRHPQLGIVI